LSDVKIFLSVTLTESSIGKATFIEIKSANVSIGYTANSTSTTYLHQGNNDNQMCNIAITTSRDQA